MQYHDVANVVFLSCDIKLKAPLYPDQSIVILLCQRTVKIILAVVAFCCAETYCGFKLDDLPPGLQSYLEVSLTTFLSIYETTDKKVADFIQKLSFNYRSLWILLVVITHL